MNRRSLLAVLGIAPVAAMFPKIAAAASLAPVAPEPIILTGSVVGSGTIVDGGKIACGHIHGSQIAANTITADKITVGKLTVRDLDDTLCARLDLLDEGKYGVELFDAAGGKIL